MDAPLQRLPSAHEKAFGRAPEKIAFAPGRVNFIGEHTDYNGGLVMPLALEQGVYAAASRNGSGRLRLRSLDFGQSAEFDMASLAPDPAQAWANCPKGVAALLNREAGGLSGVDLTLSGDLPVGAGLSSSAAAEVAVGTVLAALFGLKVQGMALALLAQKAEHEFTGTRCGIMDQAVSVLGKKERLLRLNCRDLSATHVPFELHGLKLFVVNSGVKHNLADGEYNRRRSECGEALAIARTLRPGLIDLSALTLQELEENRDRFPGVVCRRARHVLSENGRVDGVAEALPRADFETVGRLMNESHQSLGKDYEVTCVETDFLAEGLKAIPGVRGARMTGGGFGGSVIVLAEPSAGGGIRALLGDYENRYHVKPGLFEARASDGTRLISF